MNKTQQFFLALTTVAVANFGWAEECSRPEALPLTIPDGKTATIDEMVSAQGGVNAYQKFTNCLSAKLDASKLGIEAAKNDEAKAALTEAYKAEAEAYNDTVTDLENVAGEFNKAIKAFKAK